MSSSNVSHRWASPAGSRTRQDLTFQEGSNFKQFRPHHPDRPAETWADLSPPRGASWTCHGTPKRSLNRIRSTRNSVTTCNYGRDTLDLSKLHSARPIQAPKYGRSNGPPPLARLLLGIARRQHETVFVLVLKVLLFVAPPSRSPAGDCGVKIHFHTCTMESFVNTLDARRSKTTTSPFLQLATAFARSEIPSLPSPS